MERLDGEAALKAAGVAPLGLSGLGRGKGEPSVPIMVRHFFPTKLE